MSLSNNTLNTVAKRKASGQDRGEELKERVHEQFISVKSKKGLIPRQHNSGMEFSTIQHNINDEVSGKVDPQQSSINCKINICVTIY